MALCLLGLAGASFAWAGTVAEPSIDLPGDRIVRAGRWIDLQWSAADQVTELEILISTDGGRHYAVCISPRLDPGLHHFLWRVPCATSGPLRMRIRFNRGGREIEGAPTGPLDVIAGHERDPEPLALPPLAGGMAGAPEPGKSEGRSSGASALGPWRAEDDTPHVEESDDLTGTITVNPLARLETTAILASFAPHRSFPLRA
jgi:hypothetical protein